MQFSNLKVKVDMPLKSINQLILCKNTYIYFCPITVVTFAYKPHTLNVTNIIGQIFP